MGEAKKRGSFEQRQAEAVAKREAREKAWNEAQAERRKQRLEAEAKAAAIRPRESPKRSMHNRMLVAAVLAAAGMSVAGAGR